MYNSLQLTAERRYRNALKVGASYTLSKSNDNASDKRDLVWDTYDDTDFHRPSSYDRRHVLNFYYIYDLPFWRAQDTMLHNLLAAGRFPGRRSIAPARRCRW